MAKQTSAARSYKKMGVISAAALAIGAVGFLAVRGIGGGADLGGALSGVSEIAASASDLRISVLRMDAIQAKSGVLADLKKQREKYENELRAVLEKTQKALEKEKTEIEKSQDLLAREALQKRVVEYQKKVSDFQRTVAERAQAVEAAYQKALVEIQEKYLDPIVNGVISKKRLSMVLDGRFVRVSESADKSLDITDDVISSLDKRISKYGMEKPKGF